MAKKNNKRADNNKVSSCKNKTYNPVDKKQNNEE